MSQRYINHVIKPSEKAKTLQSDEDGECEDDLIFFVKKPSVTLKKVGKSSSNLLNDTGSANISKDKDGRNTKDGEYFVRRRGLRNIPLPDDKEIDWERSYFLNMLIQSMAYYLIVILCYNEEENPKKPFKTIKKVKRRVYGSPLKVNMSQSNEKGSTQEIGYPLIYFTIPDFDDAFKDMIITEPGQFIAIYLGFQGDFFGVPIENTPIFSGGLKYTAISQFYEQQKSSSLWGKLFGSKENTTQKFFEIQGPKDNGLIKFGFEEDLSTQPQTRHEKGKKEYLRLKCMPVYLCQRYDRIIENAFKKVQKKINLLESDMKKVEERAASEPMPLDKEFSLLTPSCSPIDSFSTPIVPQCEINTPKLN